MLRTTVYLEEEAAIALKRLSKVHRRPQAELIREAITTYILGLEEQSQQLPPGVGGYRSGREDVSMKAEQLLKQKARKRQ
jgi:hypothetical protein